MSSAPIRILRGRGGQVEVKGTLDDLAAGILRRAGFMTFPTLSGQWVRLPFDLGEARENQRASWAADMLTAARYPVELDPALRPSGTSTASSSAPRGEAAMTAQPPPSGHRRSR
ncbi:hypothetical protein [Streptomyces sp. AK02-01A]|uniref:hypothetical protein n=1 Tax=Streptomyces sp. AK02-01A TaxID=3028648 RepID=UPI0029AF6368|nr:hypothetical protein [Streptomyces sp. AK02-01A]MDX3855665.1 hypothetical protein [Streptomyces sp. AK02-01A]